jgi:hypothetical protein
MLYKVVDKNTLESICTTWFEGVPAEPVEGQARVLVPVPEGVDPDACVAVMTDGILELEEDEGLASLKKRKLEQDALSRAHAVFSKKLQEKLMTTFGTVVLKDAGEIERKWAAMLRFPEKHISEALPDTESVVSFATSKLEGAKEFHQWRKDEMSKLRPSRDL